MKTQITIHEPKGNREIEINAELRNAETSGHLIVSPGNELLAAIANPGGQGWLDFDIHGEAGAFPGCRFVRKEGEDIVIQHS